MFVLLLNDSTNLDLCSHFQMRNLEWGRLQFHFELVPLFTCRASRQALAAAGTSFLQSLLQAFLGMLSPTWTHIFIFVFLLPYVSQKNCKQSSRSSQDSGGQRKQVCILGLQSCKHPMCHSSPSLRRMERVSHSTPMRPGLIVMLKVLFLLPGGASHSSTLPAALRGEVEKNRRVCEEKFSQNQTMALKGKEFSSVEILFLVYLWGSIFWYGFLQ